MEETNYEAKAIRTDEDLRNAVQVRLNVTRNKGQNTNSLMSWENMVLDNIKTFKSLMLKSDYYDKIIELKK